MRITDNLLRSDKMIDQRILFHPLCLNIHLSAPFT